MQSRSDTGSRRESTSKWEHALRFAKDSLEVFQHPFENIEDMEKNGKEALQLLAQRRVFLVENLQAFSSEQQCSCHTAFL